MWQDFKKFLLRGNVLDLAVAVVIGAAFGAVVTSFVKDILMPPIGLLLGGVDFTNLFIPLNGQSYASLAEAQAAGAPTINYGLFLNTIISFIIIALAIYLVIKAVERMMPKKEVAAPAEKNCPYCARAIPAAATRCPECTSELEGYQLRR
jgi:large conductance mechanosensitive channel